MPSTSSKSIFSRSTRLQRFFIVGAAGVAALAVLLLLMRWLIERVSPPPATLGAQNGRLAPCPDSPNCVSSFAEDAEHAIEPLRYETTREEAHEALVNVIYDQPRVQVIRVEPNYVHATFRSTLMRFIDDGEFLFDEDAGAIDAGVIHVRMAARLGYEDMDANRQRVERIRQAFNAELGRE